MRTGALRGLAGAVGLIALWVALGRLGQDLAAARVSPAAREKPPASLSAASTVGIFLLGGVRAVLIDLMWMRAQSLQNDGKFFELMADTEVITYLQPELPEVWIFNAWNMGYNVSVQFDQPENQWVWVKRGLDHLDKGTRLNPTSRELWYEMAQQYEFKVGRNADYTRYLLEETGKTPFELSFLAAKKTVEATYAAPAREEDEGPDAPNGPEARRQARALATLQIMAALRRWADETDRAAGTAPSKGEACRLRARSEILIRRAAAEWEGARRLDPEAPLFKNAGAIVLASLEKRHREILDEIKKSGCPER